MMKPSNAAAASYAAADAASCAAANCTSCTAAAIAAGGASAAAVTGDAGGAPADAAVLLLISQGQHSRSTVVALMEGQH